LLLSILGFGIGFGKLLFMWLAAPPQSEYGDIYKVTLDTEKTKDGGESVTDVKVKYFDTLPPAVSLCVLKTGFLFAASETGSHGLYQFIVGASGRLVGCLLSERSFGRHGVLGSKQLRTVVAWRTLLWPLSIILGWSNSSSLYAWNVYGHFRVGITGVFSRGDARMRAWRAVGDKHMPM
jgi:hypothetical protein